MQLGSYAKIYNLGHAAIRSLLDHEVVIEEKVDGSQFSFGVVDGEFIMRSKGATVYAGQKGLFHGASLTATRLFEDGKLVPGYTYRGEALQSPQHNALAYGRVPAGHFVLWDVELAGQRFLSHAERSAVAAHLGLETVPVLFVGRITSVADLDALLNTESFLGGCKVEGLVVKPAEGVDLYGLDGKRLVGKFVSDEFREVHRKTYRPEKPNKADVISVIGDSLATPARWQKAVQRMAESGALENAPCDIGPLMASVVADIETEERESIADQLYQFYRRPILRLSTRGLPEWYKRRLAGQATEAN